ncbi:MAG: DUF4124 domain-containing protein [Gammaproteobacteria bacterium]|nr:DUF4124 domain-containing protein [Gammaproteobacteria bacterium]
MLALVASPLSALAEIYRVIDADGNISFTDKPPAGASGRTEEVDIDANTQNTSLSPNAIQQDQPAWLLDAQQKRREQAKAERDSKPSKDQVKAWKKSLRDAERTLREAKAARKRGVIAAEGDFIGKAGGGVRPSEQYFAKLQQLEQNVLDAQQRLQTLKRKGPGKSGQAAD